MPLNKMKKWIDEASYEDLLRKWRFGKVSDEFFQSEMGKYYSESLTKKRIEVGPVAAVTASKKIGW